MTQKNIFKRGNIQSDKILLCPQCYETLFTTDIEHFERCPYCDIKIYIDSEVEEYILKPIIDRWINIQNNVNGSLDGISVAHDLN